MKKPSRLALSRSAVALGAATALLFGGGSVAPLATAADNTTEIQVSADADLPETPYVFLKNGDQLGQLKYFDGAYTVGLGSPAPVAGTEYGVYVVADASGPGEGDQSVGTFTPPSGGTWFITLEFVDEPVDPGPTPPPGEPGDGQPSGVPVNQSVYLVSPDEDALVHTGLRQQEDGQEIFTFSDVAAGTYELRVGTTVFNAVVVDEAFEVADEGEVTWEVPEDFDTGDYPRFDPSEDADPVIPEEENVYLVNSDGTYVGDRLDGAYRGFFQFYEVPAGTYQLVVGTSVEEAVVVNDRFTVTELNELRGSFSFRFPRSLDLDVLPKYVPAGNQDDPDDEGSSFDLSSLLSSTFGSSRG